jgi:hypothetical protein
MPKSKDGLSLEERAELTRVNIARLEAEAAEVKRRIALAKSILEWLEAKMIRKELEKAEAHK